SPAAMSTTTAPTATQSVHAFHRSVSFIGLLPRAGFVAIVGARARAVGAPETILAPGRPPRPLRTEVLPLFVEEVIGAVQQASAADVPPATRHVLVLVPPPFAICRAVAQSPQPADDRAERARAVGRDERARRRLVERRELVGEARHRAADAHTARLHAPAHVIDRAALDDVAVDDGSPAADLDQALGIAVVMREDAFFVVAGAGAAAMHRFAEQPRRTSEGIERRQRSETLQEEQNGEDGLGEIVALRRAARYVDHRQAERAAVVFAEKIHEAHCAGRISLRRRYPSPRRAGADRDRRGGARRHALQPRRRRHRMLTLLGARRLHPPRAEVPARPTGD